MGTNQEQINMTKRAFIFPGQASQEVGMAQDIYEA
ncbi:MAG: hypothetical protein COY19_03810, partial [Candidatus Marinimicrobia bacterium CG_4_10_14_0_2_um_filter_48_9]